MQAPRPAVGRIGTSASVPTVEGWIAGTRLRPRRIGHRVSVTAGLLSVPIVSADGLRACVDDNGSAGLRRTWPPKDLGDVGHAHRHTGWPNIACSTASMARKRRPLASK